MIKSGLAAPRNFDPVYVWLGSRLCENAHERLSDTPESQANFGSVWPPKPEVCGLATPASLIARRCPRLIKPRQIRALRPVRSSERAVFHRSDGNIITRLA